MVLKSTSMNIELDIMKVSDIYPHEMFDLHRAESLKKRIFRDGFLDQPLVVDPELGMILDGTHRHFIFSKAGIPLLPVVKVSYKNSNIRIGCWYRVYRELDISCIKDVVIDDAEYTGNNYDKKLYIFRDEDVKNFILKSDADVPDVIHTLDINNRESLVEYIDRPEYKNGYVIVGYDPPSKNYVIKRFKDGKLFPVKYTRHLLPVRVVNLKMPLKYLFDIKDAYNYIDNLILTPYRVKIYMENGYEERYFTARRKH